jgi:hypothetical protein
MLRLDQQDSQKGLVGDLTGAFEGARNGYLTRKTLHPRRLIYPELSGVSGFRFPV